MVTLKLILAWILSAILIMWGSFQLDKAKSQTLDSHVILVIKN